MTKHQWICVQAGMFVSLFMCKMCKEETRDPHDIETCKGKSISDWELQIPESGVE